MTRRRQSPDVDTPPASREPASREAALLFAVRKEFGVGENFRLNRSNTGAARNCKTCENIHRNGCPRCKLGEHPSYRITKFGIPGAPDLTGVLAPLGRIIAIETKAGDGVVSEEQANYHTMIKQYGGLVCVVRSIEEAREWMKGVGAKW